VVVVVSCLAYLLNGCFPVAFMKLITDLSTCWVCCWLAHDAPGSVADAGGAVSGMRALELAV
jgi:hypothetical protein